MFYNAAMRLDRDLNVAVVRALFPSGPRSRRGWDMLAATGVRGLRLVEETDAFAEFDFTEKNAAAFEVLDRNVQAAGHAGLVSHLGSATVSRPERTFDYVDLDPFGTPAPFVDPAIRALAPAGVLAVTATDMPVLAGVARGVCERRYGAHPVRGAQGPEGGLRILIAFLMREAAKRSVEVEPVLGYLRDHYVRVFLKSRPPGTYAADPALIGDPSSWGERVPPIKGEGPFGPMWLGPLFDPELLGRLEVPKTAERPDELRGFLLRLREECAADRPFYYEPNTLAAGLHLAEPPALEGLMRALREKGFVAARSHVRPSAFRTNAPRSIVFTAAQELRPGS